MADSTIPYPGPLREVEPMAIRLRTGKASGGFLLSILLNLALAGVVAYLALGPKYGWPGFAKEGTGPGGTTDGDRSNKPANANKVSALGRIQPQGGLISVFGPPGDRVTAFTVKIGDEVAADQILGEFAGETDRKQQLDSLRVQIKEAEELKVAIQASAAAKQADLEAETAQANVGVVQDLRALDAKKKAVQAQQTRATSALKRLTDAKAEGVSVAEQEFEELRAALAQAEAETEAADAQKKKIEEVKKQGEASVKAKKATIDAETKRALVQVPLESLKTTLALTERKLKDGQLRSPVAGRVVRILTKANDALTNQPVLQIADASRMTVLAEVYETDIGKIREAATKGTIDATISQSRVLGKAELTGSVAGPNAIATVIAKNVLTPLGPREETDRRVVEVEVVLSSDASKIAANYIGLQVEVTFDVSKSP